MCWTDGLLDRRQARLCSRAPFPMIRTISDAEAIMDAVSSIVAAEMREESGLGCEKHS